MKKHIAERQTPGKKEQTSGEQPVCQPRTPSPSIGPPLWLLI